MKLTKTISLGIALIAAIFGMTINANATNTDVARSEELINEIKAIRAGNGAQYDPTGREFTHILWEAGKLMGSMSKDNQAYFQSTIQSDFSDFMDYAESDDGFFRVWYKTEGTDAINLTDADGNGVPDIAQRYARYFSTAFAKYQSFGMVLPYSSISNKNVYNVYIADSKCSASVMGYTSPQVTSYTQMVVPSYIVVRANYSVFAYGKPAGYADSSAAMITIAHEFFHACQMMIAYANMSMFTMEGGAVWSERFVYPTDQDPYDYISSFTTRANLGLNFNPRTEYNVNDVNYIYPYGAWIYFDYLTSMYGNDVMKEIYDKLTTYTEIRGYNAALKEHGTSFSESAMNFYTCIPFFPDDSTKAPVYFKDGAAIRNFDNYTINFPTSASESIYRVMDTTSRTFESADFTPARGRLNRMSAHYYKVKTDRGATITITPKNFNDSLVVTVLQFADRSDNANNFKTTFIKAFGNTPQTLHFDYNPSEMANLYVIVYNYGVHYVTSTTDYLYSTNTAYYTMHYQPDAQAGVEDEISASDFSIEGVNPMPATEQSTLNIMTAVPSNLSLKIYNMAGQSVYSESFMSGTGLNRHELNLNGYVPGSYFIEVSNGIKTEKSAFIVK